MIMAPQIRILLQHLYEDDWYIALIRGIHRQLKHPVKSGLVTVHGKPGDTIAMGTLGSILQLSNQEEEEPNALRRGDGKG